MADKHNNQLDREAFEKRPGFEPFLYCLANSYLTGLITFCLGVPASYYAQNVLQAKQKISPYGRGWKILISVVVAGTYSYIIKMRGTQMCLFSWLADEVSRATKK